MIERLFDMMESRRQDLAVLRRDLHAQPELAFQEVRTAGIIASRLRGAGLEVRTGIAQTGVVGVLRGGRSGCAVLIAALQTIVSRETPPREAAVVTIGTIQAGTAFNIISDRVEMRGTVRAFSEEIRSHTLRRVEEIVAGTAAALRTRGTVTTRFGCPAVTNDPAVTAVVRQVAARVVGSAHVVEMSPTTGSDDVAYFLERAPGCYFVVGSNYRARGLDGAHHNARFDFDEDALVIAAKVLGGAAVTLLESTSLDGR